MKGLLVLGVLTSSCIAVNAQKNNNVPVGMDLKYEVQRAGYKNSDQALSLLRISSTDKKTLPPTGWSVFFNGGGLKIADEDAAKATVIHVNGDLFKLVPKGGSPALIQEYHLVSDVPKSVSDLPGGFYLVWDASPEKGVLFNKVSVSSAIDRIKAEQELAAKAYTQNQLVTNIPAAKLPAVFPTPLSYKKATGAFTVNSALRIKAEPMFMAEAQLLAQALSAGLGKSITVNGPGSGPAIVFTKDTVSAAEGYSMRIGPQEIRIGASTAAGAFYGAQSLQSMLPAAFFAKTQKSVSLAAAEIYDKPRFGFRAFMLEVGRNFQPKTEVLKVLDLMALYKLNVLHFHLNDDEGWRLEIPGLPELTEVGSKRGHTTNDANNLLPSYGSGPVVGVNSGSGYYSRADYIEILKYAKQRHIKVIPEIETPGHARAAIKSMDARYQKYLKSGDNAKAQEYLLRDLQDKSVYRSVQGWSDNVINVALPSAYHFLEKVTDEIISMYKDAGADLETVHFGGDEVPPGVWTQSEAAKQVMAKDTAVKNADDLWPYYFSNVNKMLKKKNLYLSGWEEIGLHNVVVNGKKAMVVNPAFKEENFHTDVWNNINGNEDLAYRLANAGYKVTLTNVTNLYFDLAASRSFDEPGQYWGGYVDVDKPFYFVPFDYYKTMKEDTRGEPIDKSVFNNKVRLTEAGKSNIIGLQAPLWSETIHTPERLEYMLLPKMLSLAERAWAKDPEWATEQDASKSEALYNTAWSEFVNVIGKQELPKLDYYAGGFNYRIPAPGVSLVNGSIAANILIPGLTIRYTTDGTEVTKSSPVYKQPIPAKGTVKLAAFNQKGRGGATITLKN
ncbi:MAG: beta-N-acetylhexosaminidase [Pedobacter sp.]|jgi:hexosaminidase|nr:beta-N-acetylhexosaminidase [Pedobacter sp.]